MFELATVGALVLFAGWLTRRELAPRRARVSLSHAETPRPLRCTACPGCSDREASRCDSSR